MIFGGDKLKQYVKHRFNNINTVSKGTSISIVLFLLPLRELREKVKFLSLFNGSEYNRNIIKYMALPFISLFKHK